MINKAIFTTIYTTMFTARCINELQIYCASELARQFDSSEPMAREIKNEREQLFERLEVTLFDYAICWNATESYVEKNCAVGYGGATQKERTQSMLSRARGAIQEELDSIVRPTERRNEQKSGLTDGSCKLNNPKEVVGNFWAEFQPHVDAVLKTLEG